MSWHDRPVKPRLVKCSVTSQFMHRCFRVSMVRGTDELGRLIVYGLWIGALCARGNVGTASIQSARVLFESYDSSGLPVW